jgi:hypothetical protein
MVRIRQRMPPREHSGKQLSQKTTHLRLNRSEIETLRSLPTAHRNKSGFANFIFQLGERVDPNTGSVTLRRDEVRRIQRYIKRYKTGGYQLMLKKAFTRPLNLGSS